MSIEIWIVLLALWFNIDDLLGAKLMARLESAWLGRTRRNALILGEFWRHIKRVALPVLFVSTPAWASAGLIAWFTVLGRTAALQGNVNRMWGWLAAAFVVGSVYSGLAYGLRERISVTLKDKGPLSYAVARLVLSPGLAIELANESVEAQPIKLGKHYSNPYGPMLVVACGIIMASGLLLVPIVFGQLTWYLVLTILFGSAWIVIFMPSLALSAIAKRTGAESYFRVGKFFVALAATALAVGRVLQ